MRTWLSQGFDSVAAKRRGQHIGGRPGSCDLPGRVDEPAYAYLFGQYLGDGCISGGPRGVFKLRIACCDRYPLIMLECEEAIRTVMPSNKVGRVQSIGCTEIHSHSKHWPCLFPQHGQGRKHRRRIVLADWQQGLVRRWPQPFLRGLVQSDGCRVINRVRRQLPSGVRHYEYPRYFFSNESADIRGLFTMACDHVNVAWRQSNRNTISVARSESVALFDSFIGPKS